MATAVKPCNSTHASTQKCAVLFHCRCISAAHGVTLRARGVCVCVCVCVCVSLLVTDSCVSVTETVRLAN